MRRSHFYVTTWLPGVPRSSYMVGIFDTLAAAKRYADRLHPDMNVLVAVWRGSKRLTGYERGRRGTPSGTWGEELPF